MRSKASTKSWRAALTAPEERHLELAPKCWFATRAKLDPVEFDTRLCPLTRPIQVFATPG